MLQNGFAVYQPYLFLAIGLVILVRALYWSSNKSELKQTGIMTEGIIFDQDENDFSFYAADASKTKIVIRFVTQREEWITGVMNQDFQVLYTGQYKNGDKVKVYYDEKVPSNFYVDTKQPEWLGRLILGITGLVFALIGLYQLFI